MSGNTTRPSACTQSCRHNRVPCVLRMTTGVHPCDGVDMLAVADRGAREATVEAWLARTAGAADPAPADVVWIG